MKKRTWALALMGAPVLSGCNCGSTVSGCNPPKTTVSWDSRLPDGSPWDGGTIAFDACAEICADAGVQEGLRCNPVGQGQLDCITALCLGRAPVGLLGLSAPGDTAASWLAASAELEAAAVHAFWQLAGELEAHGLPGERARAAAYDEVRHARGTTKLALGLGQLPAVPRVAPLPEPRSLEEIAVDNGFEGCGRELFGATLNAWQAEHATDERVRALMREITPDERQHAAFSLSLAEVLMPRLTIAARRRVREAQERALATLGLEAGTEPVRRQLGLMDAQQARRTTERLLETARV
jgi:hypothetical protein